MVFYSGIKPHCNHKTHNTCSYKDNSMADLDHTPSTNWHYNPSWLKSEDNHPKHGQIHSRFYKYDTHEWFLHKQYKGQFCCYYCDHKVSFENNSITKFTIINRNLRLAMGHQIKNVSIIVRAYGLFGWPGLVPFIDWTRAVRGRFQFWMSGQPGCFVNERLVCLNHMENHRISGYLKAIHINSFKL